MWRRRIRHDVHTCEAPFGEQLLFLAVRPKMQDCVLYRAPHIVDSNHAISVHETPLAPCNAQRELQDIDSQEDPQTWRKQLQALLTCLAKIVGEPAPAAKRAATALHDSVLPSPNVAAVAGSPGSDAGDARLSDEEQEEEA